MVAQQTDTTGPAGADAGTRPLTVLHLVSYFPPDRIGGVGEVAAHLHHGLLERGHRSTVVTTGTTNDDPTVLRVARNPGAFGFADVPPEVLRCADVVHAQHGEAARALWTLRRTARRPPLVLTLHVDNRLIGASQRPFRAAGRRWSGGRRALAQRLVKSPVKAALDRCAMRHADAVSFIARSGAREVLGADAAEAPVIHNGVPHPDRATAEANPHTSLLYVGTAGHRKRTAILPVVLEQVRRDVPDATLRIVGFELETEPELARDLAERGLLGAVRCEGPQPSGALGPYYRAADVLVVPSAYEGLPMVIVEAASHGLPTVATSVGGNAEAIVDGVSGHLVAPDDPHALARACVSMLRSAHAPGAASMGQAAREIASTRFTIDAQVDAYVSLYRTVVASAATTRGHHGH